MESCDAAVQRGKKIRLDDAQLEAADCRCDVGGKRPNFLVATIQNVLSISFNRYQKQKVRHGRNKRTKSAAKLLYPSR